MIVGPLLGLLALTLPVGCVVAATLSGTAALLPAISSACPSLADPALASCSSQQDPRFGSASSLTIATPDPEAAIAVAAALSGIAGGGRYIPEGNGPVDFDCSGLTSYAWRQAGVNLVDYSFTQRAQTQDIPRSMVQPGDLVFWFGGSEHHVAIVTAVSGSQITIAEAANPEAGLRTRLLGGRWDDAYLTGFGRVIRA